MTCDCFKQRQNCSAISKLVSKCTRTSWKISRMANSKKRKHVKQNTFMKDTWTNLKHIKHVKYGVQIFWRTKKIEKKEKHMKHKKAHQTHKTHQTRQTHENRVRNFWEKFRNTWNTSKTGCKIFFKKKDPKHKLNTSNTEEEGDNLRERKCKHLRWRRKKPHQTQENVKHIKHIKHVRHIRTGQTHQTRQIQSVNNFEERSQTQRTHQIRGVKFFWRRKCQTQTQ